MQANLTRSWKQLQATCAAGFASDVVCKSSLVRSGKYTMRIYEIQTTLAKPPTPEQARVKSLQQNVEKSRDTLQAERDKQRQQRDTDRKQKLQLPKNPLIK